MRCSLALLLLPLAGCAAQVPPARTQPLDEPIVEGPTFEAPSETVFTIADMTRSTAWVESSVLSAPHGATRIGLLVDGADPEALAKVADQIDVRGFDQGGTPLPWQRAEVTWTEDRYLVARADPTQTIYGAQLRLPAIEALGVVNVAFAAIVPEPDSGSLLEEGLGHAAGALSVSGLVVSRADWKARATKCTSKDGKKARFAIHHTFTPAMSGGSIEARIRSIQAYHMDTRGWCDVGYHFLVGEDGRVFEGRPLALIGAHVSNHNSGNIGVSYVGCFQSGECGSMGTMTPSEASITAAGKVIGALADQYGIAVTSSNLKGHTQHAGASTSCPGDRLLSRLGDIIAIANGAAGSTTPGPVIAPPPTASTGRIVGVVYDASVTSDPAAPGNKRLSGAVVSVSGGPTQTATGAEALWKVDLAPGEWTLLATAPGYVPAGRTVSVTAGGETWASIGLVPTAPGVVGPASVRVETTAGLPIAGAVVRVGTATWHTADANGKVSLGTPSSPLSVTAWAPGRLAKSGQAKPGAQTTLVLATESTSTAGGTFQGVVWDASKTADPSATGAVRLPGTVVVCSTGQAAQARVGDAYWSLLVPAGTHTFTAIRTGYVPASISGAAASGGAEWGSIGLLPTGASPATPVTPPPPAAPKTVCYPGPTGAGNVCLPLVAKSASMGADYVYPTGFGAQYAAPTRYLDLAVIAADTKLAKNFTLAEFMESSKGQWALYRPSAVKHWQAVRDALGVALSVNSGYRSPGWNAGVDGSAQASRHMWGDAADVTANGKASLAAIQSACQAQGADYVQVYTTHVHCDWRNDPLETAFFGAANKPGADAAGADRGASAWITVSSPMVPAGDAVLLEARWDGFDEGTPWVRWRLEGPTGIHTREPSTTAAFVLPMAGAYRVTWEVGGMVQGEVALVAR